MASPVSGDQLTSRSSGTEPLLRRAVKKVVRAYMRLWHDLRFEGEGLGHLPEKGPALVLVNHVSTLDVFAMVAVDPYPDSIGVAKASLFKIAPLRPLLRCWGAIPVARRGTDSSAIRALLKALDQGRIIAIAAEGTRSRTGRLQPINPVLARIAARADVPIIPVGVIGSFDALPPGAWLPRRAPVTVRVGKPFRIPPGTSDKDAAQCVFDAIAALLPASQLPETVEEQSELVTSGPDRR
jgi:1-acyl-sn-glycerol-3-phosphate acyltransferase